MFRTKPSRRVFLFLLCLTTLSLSGCSGFFFKETGTSGGGTTTGNYVFVGNSGSNNVGVFQISTTGGLTAATGSPFTVPTTPTSLAVSKANTFLYVGTPIGIYGYTIGSGGVLTALASGSALVANTIQALQVSPDGQWIIALSADNASLVVYQINTSTGLLTQVANVFYSGLAGTAVARDLRITPNGLYVYAALGTGGTLAFTFNTSTGVLTQFAALAPLATSSDNAIAIDKTSANLYLVRSGASQGLSVFSINNDGSLTQKGSSYVTGSQPYSVAINSTASYVYVANRTDSTISGYNVTVPATVTTISGSPFSSGLTTTALLPDSTGSWLLAASFGGAPDLTLYGFDSSNAGRIYTVSSAASGTNASVLAVTH